MENGDKPTKQSFAIEPGTRLNLEANKTGRTALRIDCGAYGSIYLWLRREDGVAIRAGTKAPEITVLDDHNVDDAWPVGDSQLEPRATKD